MNRRSFDAVNVVVMAVTVASLDRVVASDQAAEPTKQATTSNATSPAKTWTPLRLPDGSPDMQGIWNTSTLTPLERRPDRAGSETLTELEAAALVQQSAERVARSSAPSDPNRTAPPVGGAFGGNIFWLEVGMSVATVNGERRTSLILAPPDGRIPFNSEARTAQERVSAKRGVGPYESYLDFDPGERCITDGIPWTPFGYNDNFQIVQAPGYVAILHELFAELRIIPVDGRSHLGPSLPQWRGDSRGRWQGDTLVVTTTNFADKTAYEWGDTWRAARPTLRIVERFRRVERDRIDYEFTIEDPTTFTRPWTAVVPMTKTDDRIYEYACHEGNYGLGNVLRAARAREAEDAGTGGAR